MQYVMQPIKNGLVDVSPYVRKTAAISCAKTFSITPDAIKGAAQKFHVFVFLAGSPHPRSLILLFAHRSRDYKQTVRNDSR